MKGSSSSTPHAVKLCNLDLQIRGRRRLSREARREREEEKGEKGQEGRKPCSRPFLHRSPGDFELTCRAEKALPELTGAHPAGKLEQLTRDITDNPRTSSLPILYSGISQSLPTQALSSNSVNMEPAMVKINRLVAASSLLGLQPPTCL